jgi:hypothetical protein
MIESEKVLSNIISQKFTWVEILDTENDPVGYYAGNRGKAATPQEIKKYVSEFIKDNPGTYSFHFKKHANNSASKIIKYKRINCSASGSGVIHLSEFNYEDERKKIRAELEQERQEQQKKIDYEAQLQELNSLWGRASWLVTALAESLIKKHPKLAGLLEGTTGNSNNNTTMANDTPLQDLQSMTETQKNLANESLLMLLQTMSPELLHKMASKLHSDPSLVDKLKLFL